jgi:hypothetical protein
MVVVSSGKSTTMTSFLDASNFLPVEPVLMMTKIITKDLHISHEISLLYILCTAHFTC